MTQIETAEVLTVAICGLTLLVSTSYTFYCYGRLVGYRVAVEDCNKIFGKDQEPTK